jgi:hypothetical protein
MRELALPATFLEAPYAGKTLPGIFLANPITHAAPKLMAFKNKTISFVSRCT